MMRGEVLERAGDRQLPRAARSMLLTQLEQLVHARLHGVDRVALLDEHLVVALVLAAVHAFLRVEGAHLFGELLVVDEVAVGLDGLDEEALADREEDREVVEEGR